MKVIEVHCEDLTYVFELLIILGILIILGKNLHVLDENGKLLSYCGKIFRNKIKLKSKNITF